MFSVTNTELKILPLWTRKVWPTKSGVMSERRDQVLIGFLMLDGLHALHLHHEVIVDERDLF